MIYFIQILIVVGIFISEVLKDEVESFAEPTVQQMALRLLTCYLFHLGNYKDMGQSFKRLKYLVHFPCKFDKDHLLAAYLVTVYQFTAALLSETVNLIFMCKQDTLTDIVMNYVAFAGISELDNLYVRATDKMKCTKELIDSKGEITPERLKQILNYSHKKSKSEGK